MAQPNHALPLTGAAILVSRGVKVLQAGFARYDVVVGRPSGAFLVQVGLNLGAAPSSSGIHNKEVIDEPLLWVSEDQKLA